VESDLLVIQSPAQFLGTLCFQSFLLSGLLPLLQFESGVSPKGSSLDAWSPADRTIFGGGTSRSRACLEEVGHLQRVYWDPALPSFSLCFLSAIRQVSVSPQALHRKALPLLRPKAMEPTNHELKPLKPPTQINLSSVKLIFSSILSQLQKAFGTKSPQNSDSVSLL
jgi:hypothetical protein